MAFYRSGARVRMTRAITRAMARSGGKNSNVETIERLVQNSKHRLGGSIARTAVTSMAAAIDSGLSFQASQFLFFDEGEDDDGTLVMAALSAAPRLTRSTGLITRSRTQSACLTPSRRILRNFYSRCRHPVSVVFSISKETLWHILGGWLCSGARLLVFVCLSACQCHNFKTLCEHNRIRPMASETALPIQASESVPRVSKNFPRVPAGCDKVAEPFFACFYEHGKQSKDAPDADVGNKGLAKCASLLEAYNSCVDKAAEAAPKKLFRVPEAYRIRDE